MSAGIRLSIFVLPLLAFAVWGGWYQPSELPVDSAEDVDDIALVSLPPLPDWAEESLPDFSAFHDVTEKKAAFFSFIYPRVVLANARILIQRQYLMSLSGKKTLTSNEMQWLEAQAERLRVEEKITPRNKNLFSMLSRRLDIIPPSLILAQAANESAWGTSRFAQQGNNLFGQWCFSDGCGLVPKRRIEGANHEVASFKSPYRSIRAYIQNLNRHPTYLPLRNTREHARNTELFPSGHKLAQGLIGYSERGKAYVQEILHMINYNNLSYYDSQYTLQLGYNPSSAELLQVATADENTLLAGNFSKGG